MRNILYTKLRALDILASVAWEHLTMANEDAHTTWLEKKRTKEKSCLQDWVEPNDALGLV
jgi:hypothetical protein